jgi:hypothetical protein
MNLIQPSFHPSLKRHGYDPSFQRRRSPYPSNSFMLWPTVTSCGPYTILSARHATCRWVRELQWNPGTNSLV